MAGLLRRDHRLDEEAGPDFYGLLTFPCLYCKIPMERPMSEVYGALYFSHTPFVYRHRADTDPHGTAALESPYRYRLPRADEESCPMLGLDANLAARVVCKETGRPNLRMPAEAYEAHCQGPPPRLVAF
jgi:hypothetical protein